MGNRITGLSGMDIEGMVSNLMKVETAKVDKLYRQRTSLTWKQEAYKSMANSLSTFQSKFFSFSNPAMNLKSSAFYLLKNFKVTSGGVDSKAIAIKNTSMSKNVEHKFKVYELAQAQKMTGTPESASGYSKKILSGDIDPDAINQGMAIELNLDGKTIRATVGESYITARDGLVDEDGEAVDTALAQKYTAIDADTGLDAAQKTAAKEKALKERKVELLAQHLKSQFAGFGSASNIANANKVNVRSDGSKLVFETEAGRSLSVSSYYNAYKPSASFTLKPGETNDKLEFEITGNDGGSYTVSVNTFEMVDGEEGDDPSILDGDGKKKVYLSAQKLAEKINKQLNDQKINGEYDDEAGAYEKSNFTVTWSGNDIKFVAKSDSIKYSIQENVPTGGSASKLLTSGDPINLYGKIASEFGIQAGVSTDNTTAMTVASVFGSNVNFDAALLEGKTASLSSLGITADTSISTMLSKINGAGLGVKLSHSSVSGAFTMESNSTGAANGFTLTAEASQMFNFDPAKTVRAQDAKFDVDGVMTTRETNDIKLGDLQMTLNEDTLKRDADGNVITDSDGKAIANEITVKSSSDTDTMIKNIQDFINEYNLLLTSFNTSVTQPKAKSGNYGYYEPLTDDEKSAMSDKEIELWETKAKEGLLNRDSTVTRVIDQLRGAMSGKVYLGKDSSGKDKTISLYEVGIASTDWKDMGALTVDENKLRKALEERPEDVAALFSNMSSEAYYGDRQKRNSENGLAYRLDDIVQDATRTTPHPKFGTYGYFVDIAGGKTAKMTDNAMAKRLKEINQKILDLEALNIMKENTYYNMFSKMEQAMTKSQNQMSMAGLAQ